MSGAALSSYAQQQVDERRRLMAALVQRLVGAQPDSEQHRSLLDASLAAAKHHQFADPHPREVDDLLDRLGERFGEYAAHGKQRALKLLRRQLMDSPVDSAQYEIQHRLLAFLYAASRAPLSSHYSSSGSLVEALEEEAQNAVVGPPTYLSDASSEGSWVEESGLYSPGSQLSDWSTVQAEEEIEAEEMVVAVAGAHDEVMQEASAGQPGSHMEAAAAGMAGGLGLWRSQSPGSNAECLIPSAHGQVLRRKSPYTRTSLSVWLASRRSGGHPARVLQPGMCFHERELVQQVIHMLKGVASPGPAFQLDPVKDAYLPCPGAHLHNTSQGSTRALLEWFAHIATSIRRVQAFNSCISASSIASSVADTCQQRELVQQGRDDGERRLPSLPTVAAFAAAVAEQQQGLQEQVLVLEAALSSGALHSLLQLQQRTACLAEQAALLAALVRRCFVWRGSPADTAAGLLTQLREALQQHLLQARSQGGVLASMLLNIFTASCRPMLAALHKWLYRGVLDDPFEEFFVQQAAGPAIPTDSPCFWSQAFTLRPASPGSLAAGSGTSPAGPHAVPYFLAPLADSILSAGKSMMLLQTYSSWRHATRAAAPATASSGQHVESSAASALATDGLASPAKRRLAELGALGFTADADPRQQHLAQGAHRMPQQMAAAAQGFHNLSAPSEGAQGSSSIGRSGADPPLLHQQMLDRLEAQLQEQLAVASKLQGQAEGMLPQQQSGQSEAVGDGVEHGSSHSRSSSSSSSTSTSSHFLLQGGWMQGTAASDGHTMQLLPAEDMLPPLLAVPASVESLPAAKVATITPAENRAASPMQGRGSNSSDLAAAGSTVVDQSMAERMRHAAAARSAQSTCAATEQLPLLIIPPAPLASCLSAAAAAAECSGRADEVSGGADAASTVAVQFESSRWREWYQQTAAALSQHLHVLDCLGGRASDSSSSMQRHQLRGRFCVPLSLPMASAGSACDQLWGRHRSGDGPSCSTTRAGSRGLFGGQHSQQLLSLAVEAPPLDVLLQHSLLHPVQAQVEAASSELCMVLLHRGLLRQLSAIREIYLLQSPLLEPFTSFLLRRISTATGGLDRVSDFELNSALQDALAAGSGSSSGRACPLRATAHILPPPGTGAAGGGHVQGQIPQRVHALARLRLSVEPGWPLSLVVGQEMLAQYNMVLVLLLQLRWVKQSLQSVRYQGWKAGRRTSQTSAARDGLQHQMVHMVDSVTQYFTDRVAAAGTWLEQSVEACASLDDMHRCRAKYLRAVTRYCLLSHEGVARLVHEALLHLLNACLHYCVLHRQLQANSAALQALAHSADSHAASDSGAGMRQLQPVAAGSADGDAREEGEGAAVHGLMGPGDVHWMGRRAELQRRADELQGALVALRRDWANRQRLLLRVLAAKAAEAGSHSDELRQLLAALDQSRYFEAGMG